MHDSFLTDFSILRPPYEGSQEELLHWLIKAHTEAEAMQSTNLSPTFSTELQNQLFKIGLGEGKPKKRGYHLRDFALERRDEMSIFHLKDNPCGEGQSARSAYFDSAVTAVFEELYPEGASFPDHLIHVTCTGYVSPSGAQKIAALRGASATTITHAYHMGCYASLPALRMAQGYLHSPLCKRVDIVHTELCTLHMNPAKHENDQLVGQALFADGFIKYSLTKQAGAPSFKIRALCEELLPDSTGQMRWICQDFGMLLSIAKEVPMTIAKQLPSFLERLAALADVSVADLLKEAFFAIHPGGPKIIELIARLLKLEKWQFEKSQWILENCGNMSSATLPHIWSRIPSKKALVVSLAFGPGLTLSGGVFERC
jgi:predicted naringenin-chalcone synthase